MINISGHRFILRARSWYHVVTHSSLYYYGAVVIIIIIAISHYIAALKILLLGMSYEITAKIELRKWCS